MDPARNPARDRSPRRLKMDAINPSWAKWTSGMDLGLAEWIQREIRSEIATLYASNGRNLPSCACNLRGLTSASHPLSVPAPSDISDTSYLERWPGTALVCVEPLPPCLAVLRRNLSATARRAEAKAEVVVSTFKCVAVDSGKGYLEIWPGSCRNRRVSTPYYPSKCSESRAESVPLVRRG